MVRLSDLTNQGNLDADCLGVCPLSHLLRKCQLSQRESREAGANFLPYAQTKLVSPSGRDVAQRQRGLAPSLRELDLPQAKTEGAASYLSRIRQTLARTRQRAAPSVTACAVPPSSGRKAFILRANKSRASFDTLSLGGGGFAFLRKSHAGCNMHPACCQEPAFESTAPILNLEGKTKQSIFRYSVSWWEVVDSNHRSR